jgi:hypothetical protein
MNKDEEKDSPEAKFAQLMTEEKELLKLVNYS